jgi:hypothetical protein
MAKYTSTAETELLCKYAAKAKHGIVEIGVLDGETTKSFSEHAICPIYGIDPIIPDSMNPDLVGSEERIASNMAQYKDFFLFKDYSYNAIKYFNKPFDFLFIDGDHNYDAVKYDFMTWGDKLMDYGYIAFHDSDSVQSVQEGFTGFKGHDGCIRLVQYIKNRVVRIDSAHFNWIERVDTINVFQKIVIPE